MLRTYAAESAKIYANIETLNTDINNIISQQGVTLESAKSAVRARVEEELKAGNITKKQASAYGKILIDAKSIEQLQRGMSQHLQRSSDMARTYAQANGNSVDHLNKIRQVILDIPGAQAKVNAAHDNYNSKLQQSLTHL
jgi:hypothetical protein